MRRTWLTINTRLKLFDSVIKPVMLYGCEIWGSYIFKYKNNVDSLHNMLIDVNTLMEKLQSKVLKSILQVHKQANNFAVSELGRYPLLINVISRLVKYYLIVCDRNKDSLLSIALDIHKSTKDLWFQFIKYITETIGLILSDNPINVDMMCNKLKKISNKL